MKVVFLMYSMLTGGAERTVAYLANYFADKGVDVEVAIYGERGELDFNDKVKVVQICRYSPSKNVFLRLKAFFVRRRAIKKYLDQAKPNVLFAMLFPTMTYVLPRHKYKTIISERSNPARMRNLLKLIVRRYIFRKADGIIFQTQRARDFYPWVEDKKAIVIPNAVGNPQAYSEQHVPNDNETVVAIGRVTPEKDYETLLRAFALVRSTHKNAVLQIYGYYKGKSENLLQLCVQLGIDKNVFFMGACQDVLKRVSSASCYALSSISEGMPNALMEAMAIGLPCVATDCNNGPSELIENGVNGLLVPTRDPRALADAISKMLDDRAFALQCGKNAQKIKETNSLDTIADKFLQYVKKVQGD